MSFNWGSTSQTRQINHSITRYGYTITNNSDDTSTIRPIGIGKLSTLRSKFELLMGNILLRVGAEGRQQLKIHPIFIYLLQTTIRYDFLNKIKPTEYIVDLRADFFRGDVADDQLNTIIENVIRDCRSQQDKVHKSTRICRLQLFYQKCLQLWQQRSYQYIGLLQQVQRYAKLQNQNQNEQATSVQNRQILTFCAANVKKLEPFRRSMGMLRFKQFYQSHSNYFKTFRINNRVDDAAIYITRLSREPEAVLQTIEDHVYLRKGGKGCQTTSIYLIKDIARLLNEYHMKVSTVRYQAYYTFVHPKNIIFDQFTLKPYLRYQPLLQESLGLRKHPLTLQSRVCFFPTPQSFDYFQSPLEVYPEAQQKVGLLLSDPLYGCYQLYSSNQFLSEDERSEIDKERTQLYRLKEHQLCWKYLYLSHFILKGKVFGQDKSRGVQRSTREYFVRCLRKAQGSIKQGGLRQFLGVEGKMDNSGQQIFGLTFKGILQYLQLNNRQQFLGDYLIYRSVAYHNSRSILLRQAIKILVSNNALQRMFNVKKYLCIFAILATQILEQIKTVVDLELGYQIQIKQIREIFQRQVKYLLNGRNYHEYLQSTYQRIEKYLERQADNDIQARYIQQDIQAQKYLNAVRQIKIVLDEMVTCTKNLQIDHQPRRNNCQRTPFSQIDKLRKLADMISNKYWPAKKTCYSLLVSFFKVKSLSNNYKIPPNDNKAIRSYSLFDRRLQNIINALFQFHIEDFTNYESLVLPLLQIPQNNNLVVVKVIDNEADEVWFEQEMVKMQTLEQVVGSRLGSELREGVVLKHMRIGRAGNISEDADAMRVQTKQSHFMLADTQYAL